MSQPHIFNYHVYLTYTLFMQSFFNKVQACIDVEYLATLRKTYEDDYSTWTDDAKVREFIFKCVGPFPETSPVSGTFSVIDISSTISSDNKYRGGVLGPNGMIYCIPHVANSIGVFDPSTKIFSTIDVSAIIGTGSSKYGGGVVAGNGKI